MPECGGKGRPHRFCMFSGKTGLSGIPAAAGTEYNEKTRKIHTKTEKFQNLSVLYFSRLLTFSVMHRHVQNGQKSKKIQHMVLAKREGQEYTFPCLRDVERKAGKQSPFSEFSDANRRRIFRECPVCAECFGNGFACC